jgi:hypothetical protein
MRKTKRGFLLHAFGNKDLDYGKLAVCCALSIKTNLKNNSVTVVMDEGTQKWLKTTMPKSILKQAFDEVIISNKKFKSGKRRHYDSPWVNFKAEFNNQTRTFSYEYSPYEETILIDADYILMNDNLDYVWGNNDELLMNRRAINLKNQEMDIVDQRISNHGIPMYWATVVYFKKSEFTKTFFNLVDYIRKEYNFFQFLYGFKQGFYRNDYSFSIAAHILNGYITSGIKSLPESSLLTSYQTDTIAAVKDSREIIFISSDTREEWRTTLINVQDMNVHIMNKRELLRVSNDFIKSCMEKL